MNEVRLAGLDELSTCLEIRLEVFVEGQDVPLDEEVDGLDEQCTHFLGLREDRALATARLRITEHGEARAERVAVLEEVRGTGLGAAVMKLLEDTCGQRGHHEVVLHAQVPVIPFYEHLGYVPEGPVFMDCDIPHRTMRKAL
jgi:predicted GNAT family N-acyltransferase